MNASERRVSFHFTFRLPPPFASPAVRRWTQPLKGFQPPVHPRPLPPAGAGRSLEFRNVGFRYPVAAEHVDAAPRWVLRGVSATVPAGGTLAIVGATGSGKSALIDLVPRLYDPQEGEVLLDGIPVRELAPEVLRAEIGYVPQESFLFGESILANLTYGGATPEAAAGASASDEHGVKADDQ